MASEQSYITTPLNHQVVIQLENLREDIWEAKVVYAQQSFLVGRFKGKDHAIRAAKGKAEQVADGPAQIGDPVRKPRKKKDEQKS
jgi:hypothetical protein